MISDTTSTGMPPVPAAHDALAMPPVRSAMSKVVPPVQSLLGEGKAQVKSTLDGVAEVVRDIATKLEGNGAAPLAKYVRNAANTVAGWADTVEHKSVDDLLGDTRTLVRTSPALAVGVAVAAGFVVSRIVRAR